MKLELVNDNSAPAAGESLEKSLIPTQARVPGATPAVIKETNITGSSSAAAETRLPDRLDKLRILEDSLEAEKQKFAGASPRQRLQECLLKSSLWLTDRMAGQSSPKHLSQLDRLAQVYLERQRNDMAELTYLRALHIREQFYGKGQPELAISVQGLAAICELRGDFVRAEELYKEAIELQENGLRKILFLYSEKVSDAAKLSGQLDQLFNCVSSLSRLYASQGRQHLCAVVYEKALALSKEIVEREPSARTVLDESVKEHLRVMSHLA